MKTIRNKFDLLRTAFAKLGWEVIPIVGLALIFTCALTTAASGGITPVGFCGTTSPCVTGAIPGGGVCVQYLSYPTGIRNGGLKDWAEFHGQCGIKYNPAPVGTCGGAIYSIDPICP